jgi:hypothetical protein
MELLFEAGTMLAAILTAYLPVIRAHFRQRAIAPAVADVFDLFAGSGKHLVLLGRDVHLFGPEIFAEIWVHGVGDWLNG